jgi:CheY-like chemotaxis protein
MGSSEDIKTILVVDDDPTIRMMFAKALGSVGAVETANNGIEALVKLRAKAYSAVLLDWHMPGVDGANVLHTVRAKAGPNGHTPVIVVTADPTMSARTTAMHDGAVYFLNKPVSIATLIVLVKGLLSKKPASPGPARSAT